MLGKGKMLLDKAICFAARAHAGQVRKGTTTPYIFHPLEAATICATITDDEEVLAAAVLHDVVEDTDTTIGQVEAEFGPRSSRASPRTNARAWHPLKPGESARRRRLAI